MPKVPTFTGILPTRPYVPTPLEISYVPTFRDMLQQLATLHDDGRSSPLYTTAYVIFTF